MAISTLALAHITYTVPGDAEPLFSDVTATFPQGWTAVLGDNGIGKTTLMHIATGLVRAEAGTILPSPGSMIIGFCSQNTDEAPTNLEDFAADWSAETMAIRRDLGIDDDWPWRYAELSGGEAKRLQIACALAQHPDVLILDEPTNHVDEDTCKRIIAVLRRFHGIGIVVSHDVDFIDALATRCVFFERDHIHGRNVTVVRTRPGNYSQASVDAENERRSADDALRMARREVARLEKTAAQRRHDAALATTRAQSQTAHATISRRDHDARNLLKLHKSLSTDGSAGAASARIASRTAAARRRADDIVTTAKRYDGDIWMDAEASHRTELVRLEPQLIRYGGGLGDIGDDDEGVGIPLLSVGPHDRIGIIGDNGTGKTTLFRALLKHAAQAQPPIPVLSMAQNTTARDARDAMRRLSEMSDTERSAMLSAYAQLNADPDRLLAGEQPSPGELRKLLLCLGARRHPHLIMLDEPTNHLDLHSRQALAKALAAFPGAVIVISHDRAFLRDAGIATLWECRRNTDDSAHPHGSHLTIQHIARSERP
ncbi:ATP-binding cassette domain-containing protein [Bifidobacterium callimiconis]|uniref:ABC transporter n=1 Tax=Bifidobacterium callimiconis TaxID=2306973 RepID=A0A430FGA5_9BIFI|nr:ATP-binding cassette domain-containing protein [Bifidobacterium callimiconis]MBT1176686.1 ABC-F family ATP-binding cassette domain-containing protein [Bifidobacterium callimiconis]RSX51857.1 ABC transporter [Bifidobacterium callimiconis]